MLRIIETLRSSRDWKKKYGCILKYGISAKTVGKFEKVHIFPIWQEKWIESKNVLQKLLFLII